MSLILVGCFGGIAGLIVAIIVIVALSRDRSTRVNILTNDDLILIAQGIVPDGLEDTHDVDGRPTGIHLRGRRWHRYYAIDYRIKAQAQQFIKDNKGVNQWPIDADYLESKRLKEERQAIRVAAEVELQDDINRYNPTDV